MLTLMVSLSASVAVADETGFVQRVYTDNDGDHSYSLFVPEGYSADKQWPIVVFLHGAGERGADGVAQTQVGLGPFLKEKSRNYPFLALFPQCEDLQTQILQGWNASGSDGQRVYSILEAVENDYSVDPAKRILTGWSMGGYGAWQLAAAKPDMWSAVLPVSSGANADTAALLKDVPVWVIHGRRDNVVRSSAAGTAVDALRDAGGSPWFSLVAEQGHDVWKLAYGSDAVYEWMLNPVSEGSPPSLRQDVSLADQQSEQFKSVLDIPDALSVRLNNRMLKGLSYAIPARVPADALRGSIPDIYDSTVAEGIRFAVTFSRISYTAGLKEAVVKAVGPKRLNLQFALENANLTIGATYVRGSGRSATAGPITIGIGHRRPVWLSIDVEPYIENRSIRFRLLRSDFNIPHDNWYVTQPYGVSVRGFGMTRSRVSSALVQGVYSRKSRIEREVSAAVPSILSWAEDTFDLSDAGSATAAVWPLPVYKPQAEVWPQSVSIDNTGVSIALGMSVASPTVDQLPHRTFRPVSRMKSVFAEDDEMGISINTEILKPLSQLLVESQMARINVLDIPGESFADLADRNALLPVIPDLAATSPIVEIRTELSLQEPMSLSSAPAASSATTDPATQDDQADSSDADANPQTPGTTLALSVPKMKLTISTREPVSDATWQVADEFEVSITQQVKTQVEAAEEASTIRLVPVADVDMAVSLATDAQNSAATADRIQHLRLLLTSAWDRWISGQTFSETDIAALDFQQTRLQLDHIRFVDSAVVAGFQIAPVRIDNLSEEDLTYDVKGPVSGWGGPYVLKPGETHRYDDPYSLTYRQISPGEQVVYTLKPGSHSQFRTPKAGGPPALFRK
jgi:predicted esterase